MDRLELSDDSSGVALSLVSPNEVECAGLKLSRALLVLTVLASPSVGATD